MAEASPGRKRGAPRMLTPTLICPEFIGRIRELDALADRRRAAAAGHGSVVLVGGDAGIGKTRLLRAFRESLTNGRAAVGTGAYAEFGSAPYGALAEALAGIGATEPIQAAHNRDEQHATLQARIAAACARRNVVLLLEDIHWADDASFTFLLHLLRSIAKLRLLVVLTYRTDEVHRTHPATPYLARLTRDPSVQRITLEPLAPPEMQHFVRATLQGHPRLPRAAVHEIVERCEGNPFFTEELLKNALERLEARTPSSNLPLTLRGSVAERLALLGDDGRATLSLAAIIGRSFEADFLAEIAERPLASVLSLLRSARDLQLVAEGTGPVVSYTFRHALTREAIYEEMLVAEVRPLHRRIVRALERQPVPAGTASLGYHAWAGHDGDRAVRYNEQAGDEAGMLHAYDDAVRSYERALEFAETDDVRGTLLAKAATNTGRGGNAPRAARLALAAIEAYRRAGRADRIADLYLFVAGELHAAGESNRAIELMRDGLRSQPQDAAPLDRARLALPLAYMELDRGAVREAAQLIDASGAALGDPILSAMYRNTCVYLCAQRGDAPGLRVQAALYLDAAGSSGDPERIVRAHHNIAHSFSILGLDAEAGDHLAGAASALLQRPIALLDTLSSSLAARHHARAGRFHDGRRAVEAALAAMPVSTIAATAVAVASLVLGRVLCDDDLVRRASAAEVMEAAFVTGTVTMIGSFAGPYARYLHDRGRRDDALAVLRRALEAIATPIGATETLLAAVELGGGALDRAAFALARVSPAELDLSRATTAHMHALVAHRERDASRARDAAETARGAYEAMGWHYSAAQCLELAGERRGALKAFTAMGAIFDVRRLQLGDAPGNGVATAQSALTPREWEISRLVSSGTPNRVVATRLAISQKTVEKHLTAIYEKLGFRNRSELAAYVARRP